MVHLVSFFFLFFKFTPILNDRFYADNDFHETGLHEMSITDGIIDLFLDLLPITYYLLHPINDSEKYRCLWTQING